MKKISFVIFVTILALSLVLPARASVTARTTVDDSLFIAYDFENLDQAIYEQAAIQFNAETIPKTIIENLEKKNQTLVQYGFGSQPIIFDNEAKAVRTSFFLGGSDTISFTVNKTTMERMYKVETEWRKFQVNLTDSFSVDFALYLDEPVSEWQRPDETTFYYENKETDTLEVSFYLTLPTSAMRIQVQENTIVFDMPPRFEDQLLNSPFLILGALSVALVIILVYRKAR